jgi:hypothetical protein
MNRATWLQGRRMLKFRDVLNRWERRELSMMEAGELLGMSERQFRRYRERFEEDGEAGLIDRRLGKPSPKRIAAGEIDRMLELYRNVYRGWNVKHFHEHGMRDHQFAWGYTWTKTQLHTAGLVERAKRRGAHRRKRERKPCEGMMLHQDGSQHVWLEGQPPLDLIVTMDDATSTIYSAFLVEQEGTISSFCGLLEVFEARGLPCSIYSDRASHYFHTDKAGEAVDKAHLTQVGRALDRLGIEHIPAYSPEARGRSERMFGTLQDRLVKELKHAGLRHIDTANRWIRKVYLPRHNARFAKPAALPEEAFVAADRELLRETLCIEEERVVGRDNTVAYKGLRLQLPESRVRAHICQSTREGAGIFRRQARGLPWTALPVSLRSGRPPDRRPDAAQPGLVLDAVKAWPASISARCTRCTTASLDRVSTRGRRPTMGRDEETCFPVEQRN